MMRSISLFWKIFFWFWLAMIIMIAAIAGYTAYLKDAESDNVMSRMWKKYVDESKEAQLVLANEGLAGLRGWLSEPGNIQAVDVYLFTMNGKRVLGEELPERLDFLIKGPWLADTDDNSQGWFIRKKIVPPGERPYRFLSIFKRPHPLKIWLSADRISIALLISGLVCFWFARYITMPIQRLRLATQKVAAGDLEVRVGRSVGHRLDVIGKLGRDFDIMAQRLQTLMDAQQQLLRDVSHELRSPLARLQVALELARQRTGKQAEQELNRIRKEVDRLDELIGQMLSLVRMESPNQRMEAEPVDVTALVEAIVHDTDYEARAANRHIRLTSTIPCTMNANEALLYSAIENVVRNALKYTHENTSVDVSMTLDAEDRGMVRIRVTDHGPGVPESALPKLFEPFVRVGDARDRDSGGYGLGLTIADRAVRLHGGTIRAHNLARGGLCIDLRLPVREMQAAAA